MWWWHMPAGCGWFGGLWGLFGVGLVIVFLGVAGIVLWRALSPRGRAAVGAGAGDALGILRARYARGELSREEFERMRKDLDA